MSLSENQNTAPTSSDNEEPVSPTSSQNSSSSNTTFIMDSTPTPRSKSHNKLFLAASIVILIVIVAFGVYFFKFRNNNSTTNSAASVKNVSSSVTSANDNFGVNVFDQLVKQSPNKNIFISPTSIAMALSMVYNGADGSTKTAMQHALDYQGLSLSTINNTSSALLIGLKNPDPEVTLSIANSVWLKKGFTVNKSFLNTTQRDYQANATSLDFNSSSVPATINNWVSGATNGKIPTIVNSIPPNEIMYLINAVYFKGAWHTKFDPSQTQDYAFTTGSGSSVQTPLMTQTGTYNYYSDNSLQAIQLPYGKNQRISMNVYLPTNMTTFLQSLSYDQLANINSKYTKQKGTILLPKFTLTYSQNLNNTLEALGMGVAFNAANFNGIAKGLHISDVEHKTYINVDEQGTTAAAATRVGVEVAIAEPIGFFMEVNKPFVLIIQDSSTKEVLFVGVIQNPSQ